jgi:MoaE-MoaD fusion protein
MRTVTAASFATMRIQLLLFALYRDLTGVDEMTVDVPDGATAGSAIAALRAADRRFVALPERPVVAINREYALLDERLSDGDELALLPPVAGG